MSDLATVEVNEFDVSEPVPVSVELNFDPNQDVMVDVFPWLLPKGVRSFTVKKCRRGREPWVFDVSVWMTEDHSHGLVDVSVESSDPEVVPGGYFSGSGEDEKLYFGSFYLDKNGSDVLVPVKVVLTVCP